MLILAGDIGGTKSNLGLFERSEATGELRKLDEKSVPTNSFPSPEDMMVAFVANRPNKVRIDTAAFGIAGPVTNGVCEGENLPWKRQVRDTSLAQALNVKRASLLNDLAATANGVRFLKDEQIVTLHEGEPVEHGNIAVIAAGTGLGEAALIWQGTDYEPLPLEGGHTDLAIRNEEEVELFKFLLTVERPVNQEAVLCGSGLFNVYRFLKSTGRYPEPPELAQQIEAAGEKEKPGLVSQFGLARKAPIYDKALDIFVSMYGARAGNLAMTLMATAGIF
ncbi:MAG TPA: glucokinase, partial [Beijerinckiaceae bacterium]|nr:glucokinase [Beijerinckiaceae bacterium]